MIRNSKGFSLVSVMVSAGIAGGVALVSMKLYENIKGVENRSTGVMDARETLAEVRTILENEKHCRLSLKDLSFRKSDIDEPSKDPGLPLELWLGNPEGTARTKKMFYAGSDLGKATINSIKLFMNNGTGTDYGSGAKSDIGLVRLSYSFKGQGEKTLNRDFLINVDFNTNASGTSTILGCERSGIKSMCESLNMDYNPQTQKCLNPIDVCDELQVVAPDGGWSGWKEQSCSRIDGGFIQSVVFTQSKNNTIDSNGLKIKCCYSRKFEISVCTNPIVLGDNGWWTGTREGVCNEKPRGFMRKIEFYQGTGEGKDTNQMKVQCCYPN